MHYSLSGEGRLLKVQVADRLTKAEILDLWDRIEAHPAYLTAAAGLVRLAYRIKWDLTGEDITDLAKMVIKLRPLPWAFVAQDPLSFGMIRMFAGHARGEGKYCPFDSEDSGREWLRPFLLSGQEESPR
jgi:hypothetical protein